MSTLTYTSANAIREGDHIVLSREEIGAPGFEGPNVSPIKHFKKHRYVYGSGTCCNGFYANAVSGKFSDFLSQYNNVLNVWKISCFYII